MRKLDMIAAAALLLMTPAAFAQKSVKAPKNLTFGYIDGEDVVSIEVNDDLSAAAQQFNAYIARSHQLLATLALGLAIVVRIHERYGTIEEQEILDAD